MAIDMEAEMTRRAYVSPMRAAAAAEKRARVLDHATKLLGKANIATFSLEAVAAAAGVTRVTVYKQFGSRRGLLEAVFDRLARSGGLQRVPAAMAESDPSKALRDLVEIFCEFWASDPAVGRLHDAMAFDPEFSAALTERNEMRRERLAALVERLTEGRKPPRAVRKDTVDFLFVLTSCATYRQLSPGRSAKRVAAILASAANDAVERLATDS